MSEDRFRAAVAAGVAGSEGSYAELLRSIVQVARAIFSAKGSSIWLLDEQADELVVEAVAREEDRGLLGMRMPSGQGIAGWVLTTRQPIVIEDVQSDPRHAKDVAERTGYVPKGLMAVPSCTKNARSGCSRCSTGRPLSAWGRWTCSGCSRTRPPLPSTSCSARARRRACSTVPGRTSRSVARLAAALDGLEGKRRESCARAHGRAGRSPEMRRAARAAPLEHSIGSP